MDNIYYVYKHTFKNGKVYIGKGSNNRILEFNGRRTSPYWQNIFKKYYYVCVEKIKENLTEPEALQLEKNTIQKYINKGYKLHDKLINLTLGGEGVYGLKHSDESKQKMSEKKKGKPSPRKGIKITDPEVLKRFSEAQKGKKRSKESIKKTTDKLRGRKRSKEEVKAISEGRKGMKFSEDHRKNIAEAVKKQHAVSVNIYNYKTKELVAENVDLTTWAEANNVNKGNLRQVLKGNRKSASGYYATQI